ncbi:GIY-YIG nuclease family protein [Halodesulfovibrio sp. MK-HDV]|uniref:GIY-YIG nuclease family protein n=1 Tax=Halodesulfovibrio sp. MK-HDV TaxID=2599925 RepID=UPI0013701CDB|nr:GIY-YIG nuclease family protein [Halodesulfovibrio sp. MK-HDV]KAF1075921.1 hypothetical protein MKHDV_01719 [Halodesulfovibrio sp. MK-HDV]
MLSGKQPFSIHMFLPDGDPEGLRIISRSNWTGVGVAFTRTGYKTASKEEEFSSTGVYILVGIDNESSLPAVYIGEGDPVLNRLNSHYAEKDFWDWGIFFASKDGSLNKAHVKYLESRLLQLAKEAKKSNLTNSNGSSRPTLSKADTADVESFLIDVLRIVPLVGLSIFDKPDETEKNNITMLYASGKGLKATGYESSKGFVVTASSEASLTETPSLSDSVRTIRKDLRAKTVIREDSNKFTFAQDYIFKSPSMAADVVLGRSANGRTEWRDKNGRTLKKLQEQENNTA